MLEKEGGALCGHNLKGELFVSLDLNVQSRSVVGNREKISKLDNYCSFFADEEFGSSSSMVSIFRRNKPIPKIL